MLSFVLLRHKFKLDSYPDLVSLDYIKQLNTLQNQPLPTITHALLLF